MEYVKIIGVVFGAAGFWRGIEFLFKWKTERKLKRAETKNLNEQANTYVVTNWVKWCNTLEEQVKELKKTIEQQHQQIDKMQKHLVLLEKRNRELETELNQLRKHGH